MTILSDTRLSNFITDKIGLIGNLNSRREIIYNTDTLFQIDNKKEWTMIHSNKLSLKNDYLKHLLEKEELEIIPFRLFKFSDTLTSQKINFEASFNNTAYFVNTNMNVISYKLFVCFKNGTEYMINLNNDNLYFTLLDKPELIPYYRIEVLATGKYIFYINKVYLQQLTKPDEIFIHLIKYHQIQTNISFNMLHDNIIPPATPCLNTTISNDSYNINKYMKEPFFPHQIDNINWMLNLEKMINLGITKLDYINTLGMIEFKIGKDQYYTNHSYQTIFSRNSLTNTPRQENLVIQGGVLSDEPGMGKTRSLIGLILFGLLYQNQVNLNKKIVGKYEKEDKNKEEEDDDEYKLENYYQLMESCQQLGQTLVIAPSHIIDIWQEEIGEIVNFSIKYLVITNMVHVKKLKNKLISDYHIIILSNNLLANKKFYEFLENNLTLDFRQYLWHRIIIDEAEEVLRPDIGQYYCDSKTNQIQSYLYQLKSFTNWCLTSNPFQYKESNLSGYLKFLGKKSNNDVIYNLDMDDIKTLITGYFRRHDKKKIVTDLPMPIIKEEVVYLKQSKIEKAIYQSALRRYNKLRLMQLCTHILISEEETKILGNFAGHQIMALDEIEKSMITYYKQKIKSLESETKELKNLSVRDETLRIKLTNIIKEKHKPSVKECIVTTNNKVKYLTSLLDDYLSEYICSRVLSGLSDCSQEEIDSIYQTNREILTKHQHTLEYQTKENLKEIKTLENQMGLFKESYISESVKEPCFICYQHFDKVIITECRHIFCGNCMKTLFQNKKHINCPLCRRSIAHDDLKVTDIKLIEKATTNNLDIEDINKYGTKLAYLIQRVRDLLITSENMIIILSQWSSMVSLISNALLEFKILHVICKSCSKTTMNRFDETRVLLLTPESCVMGNDLTKASHIIMTDVLMMSKQNASAIENQLFGYMERLGESKEIKLIRLVIQETIEEDYYKKQKN